MNGHDHDATPGVEWADGDPPSPLDALLATRIGRRVRDLRVEVRVGGLVLRGRAESFHVKQLAQQAATAVTALPVIANRIEVAGPDRGPYRPGGADDGDRAGRPPRRVLLATGDDSLLALGREHLAAHGYAVATASGGLACVKLVREFAPDVVILDTDLHWGGADGVLAHLRSAGDRDAAVVLLASPFADFRAHWAQPVPPVVLVLDKPVGVGALLRAIRSVAVTEPTSPVG
jgi:CheY-like chemotaxis protein